jgi:hypothetical protein
MHRANVEAPGTTEVCLTTKHSPITFLSSTALQTEPGAGTAQSVQGQGTGWTTEESEFEYMQSDELSLLHSVQPGPVAHPASYAKVTV